METPPAITDSVVRLQQRIGCTDSPVYVRVSPVKFATFNECHPNVIAHVKTHGGDAVPGWCVWESQELIEGVFHSVWRSPAGELIDITPHRDEEKRILFIPDNRHAPDGTPVENIRVCLVDTAETRHTIRLNEALFALRVKYPDGMNVGRFLDTVSAATMDTDGCPCGSLHPFAVCHKSAGASEQYRAWRHLIG